MNGNFFLYDAFAWLLAFFYSIIPSYGFAIIGMTLVVMIAVTPLTLKGTRSMMMMQRLQPEIKKIQSRYKDDRQKLNEELLKFYNENNINPLGGCLPLLVQMPIFLFLYQVLRGLTLRDPTTGANVGWVSGELGVGDALTNPPNLVPTQTFDPAYLDESSQLYTDLHQTTTMNFAGMDLAVSASEALRESFVTALPYLFFVAVVAVTGYVQQRQIQARNKSRQQDDQPNPQAQMLKYTWIMLPVFSFILPSGLVLYFVTSNLYRVGQQWFISRSIYKAEEEGAAGGGKGRAEKKEKAAVGAGSSNGGGRGGKTTDRAKEERAARRTGNGGSSPTKSTSKSAAKGSSKSASTRSGGAKGSGRSGGRGSGSGRSSSGKTGGSSSKGEQPTLQPRARKKKK